MMSSVIADCPDNRAPNILDKTTPVVIRDILKSFWSRPPGVQDPSASTDLPVVLRSLLMTHPSKCYIPLKSFFFGRVWAGSASE